MPFASFQPHGVTEDRVEKLEKLEKLEKMRKLCGRGK